MTAIAAPTLAQPDEVDHVAGERRAPTPRGTSRCAAVKRSASRRWRSSVATRSAWMRSSAAVTEARAPASSRAAAADGGRGVEIGHRRWSAPG